MKKVRILQQIMISGEPAREGSVHELPEGVANELISQGVVVHHLEDAPVVEADDEEKSPRRKK